MGNHTQMACAVGTRLAGLCRGRGRKKQFACDYPSIDGGAQPGLWNRGYAFRPASSTPASTSFKMRKQESAWLSPPVARTRSVYNQTHEKRFSNRLPSFGSRVAKRRARNLQLP